MSIADKITSIENHLSADYEGLTNLGVDLTNINKNIENIKPCLDTIWNNLPKVSDTGTEVTLSPTLKGKLGIVEKGNSTQVASNNLLYLDNVTGNASYDEKMPTITNGVINVKGTDDTSYNEKGKYQNGYVHMHTTQEWTTNTTYYISMKIEVVSNQKNLSTDSFTILLFGQKTGTITYNSSTGRYEGTAVTITSLPSPGTGLYLELRIDGMELNISEISLKTTNSYTFEGYGISPTPNVPSPIKSVTGDNNVVVEGKNLFDNVWTYGKRLNATTGAEENNENACVSDYIPVDFNKNPNYYLSGLLNTMHSTIWAYNSNKQGLHRTANEVRSNLGLTSSSFVGGTAQGSGDIAYIRINMRIESGDTGTLSDISNANMQLELGSTATTYEPYYTPQTLPLNLGSIELNGINTYKDLIFRAVNGNSFYDSLTSEQKALLTYGKWYKHIGVREVSANISDMNNSETYPGWKNTTLTTQMFSDLEELGQNTHLDDVTNYLCNIGIEASENCIIISNRTNNVIFIYGSDLTQTEWKTNYSSLVFKLYYGLPSAKQEDIEITDQTLISQLEEIDKMQSYNGTTIITSTYDTNNAQMILQVSSLKGE